MLCWFSESLSKGFPVRQPTQLSLDARLTFLEY